MASLYDRFILPRFLACACSASPIMRQRQKIVPKATGKVLELGIGLGLNLAFYDPDKVEIEFMWSDSVAEMLRTLLNAEKPNDTGPPALHDPTGPAGAADMSGPA